jgi:nucleoside-diphosphate-sugar epimerase
MKIFFFFFFLLSSFIDAAKEAHVEHIIFLTPFTPLDPVSPPVSPSEDKPTVPMNDGYGSYRSQFMLIESHLHSQFDDSRITILRYPGVLFQHLFVFGKYIAQHNAFPLPHQHLEITVESCSMIDIARATACVAYSPTVRHSKNSYKITSPQLLTLEEVSQKVLQGLERETTINLMDMPTLQDILTQSIGNEDHAVFLLEMWGIQQQKLSGRRLEITRDLEVLTGQSGKTLNEYLKEDGVRDAFLDHSLPLSKVA